MLGLSGASTNHASATASSISLSLTDTVISVDALPTASGTFYSSDTSSNNISVMTDNYTGYTLGISASVDNDNELKYIEGSTTIATIPSITNPVTASDYTDDTYASTNNLNNTWGFRPSKYNSVDNTTANNYYPAPTSTSSTVLDTTSSANPSTANNYNIAIGTRISSSQTPGAYSNTFIITAIANAIPYTITYNKNAGTDTVNSMPSNVNSSTYSESVPLANNTPTRAGYTFAGWCTVAVNADATCASGSGTGYARSGTWNLNQTSSSNNLTLYAVWTVNSYTCTKQYRLQNADGNYPSSYTSDGTSSVKYGTTCSYTKNVSYYNSQTATCTMSTSGCTLSVSLPRNTFDQAFATAGKSKNNGYYVMQDMTSAICSAPTYGSTTTLKDNRDGNVYLIGKLKDGKCWMMDNLRLGSSSTVALTTTNTNSSKNLTLPASRSSYSMKEAVESMIINSQNKNNTTTGYGSGSKKRGVYYNYCAASAGTICTAGNTTNASYDICPKNWSMPSNSNFNSAWTASGGTVNSFVTILSIPLAGVYILGDYPASDTTTRTFTSVGLGTDSFIWSSTYSSGANSYFNRVTPPGSSSLDSNYGRCNLMSIRCLAK